MSVVCISCFDYYDLRMNNIIDYFDSRGETVSYLFADFDHWTRKYEKRNRKHAFPIHVPSYSNNISVKRLFSHYVFSKKVGKFLKNNRPSIVYCMVPPNYVVKEVAKYKKKHNAKIVFDIYDSWPESLPVKTFKKLCKLPLKIWADIRNDGLKEADLIVLVAKEGIPKVTKWINNADIPIDIIYPVIRDIERPNYSFRKNDNKLSFCYLGNVNYITDIDLMIKLFREIRKYTEICIHFIGGGLNHGELLNGLRNIGVEVVSHGVLFGIKEKNKVFSMCDMGINLPKKEIHSTMSLKSVEYLRAGLPFLNTGLGDNWEMVEKYCIGVNVLKRSLREIAKSIAKLSTEDLNKMHQNCISVYDNCFLGQDYEKIFEPVLPYKSL